MWEKGPKKSCEQQGFLVESMNTWKMTEDWIFCIINVLN